MIFNEKLLFIHNGKTGGSSCTQYLLENLGGLIRNCDAEAGESGDARIINLTDINRHCTLRAARQHLSNRFNLSLSDFERILVCIRHPYTLETSFYHHLRKPEVRERRKKSAELLALADGPFEEFIQHAGFHRAGLAQQDYFLVDGTVPENVQLIRYETLAADFIQACRPYLRGNSAGVFPHINQSARPFGDDDLLSGRAKRLIREKHAYMFEAGYYSA